MTSLELDVPKIVTVHWARVTDSQVNATEITISVCKDGLASLVKVSPLVCLTEVENVEATVVLKLHIA